MTSSIINYIVEKYLANILEINTENTKSSLFSGTVEMCNLKIKPEIFTQVNLPYFELVDGYVGSLKIQMSLPRFYKYPIKISIDKVFFHARQKSLDKLNELDEIKAMETYKQSKLNSMEEITSQVTELSAEEPGMAQQIMNNLQIEIGEIVFRFDDDISVPGNPFVFGLILKKILIKTTTDKFEEDSSSDNIPLGEINNKLIKVSGLSMFLDYSGSSTPLDFNSHIIQEEKTKVSNDLTKYLQKSLNFYTYCMSELNHHSKNENSHHFLLFDLTTTVQIAMNENIKKNKLPKMACNLLIDSLIFNLELKQLSILFKLMAYLNLNNLYRVGIYTKFYRKEFSIEEKKLYMEKYIEYYKYKFVKKYLDVKHAEKIKEVILQNEAGLTYDQVQSMRQAAMIRIDYLFNMENIDSKIAEVKAKWKMFSYFRGNDDEQLKDLNSQKEKLQGDEEKYNKMIQEQLALEKGIELDMYKDLPSDYIQMSLSLELKKCVFAIGELDCRKLIDMVFVEFEIKILLGLNFQNIFLYLSDFYVNQYKFKHPFFNRIIESYQDEGKIKDVNVIRKATHSSNIAEIANSFSQRKGALYIEFENNPANELSNYRFKLRNEKRLYMFANIYVLQYAMTKILDSLKSNIDLSEISNYAKGEVQKYIEEGKQYSDKILSGDYPHFNIDTDILLKGPVIIIPQNIHDTTNTSCMLFSLGECQISSALPPRMDPLVDYTKITNINKMYDVYTVVTQGFQLATMGDYTTIGSIFSSKTKLDIIENVNIEVKIGNLIQPKNEHFENFRLSMKILNTTMYLRDIQIEYMIYFLDGLTQINKLLKSELEITKVDLEQDKISTGVLAESIGKSTDPEERRLLLGPNAVPVPDKKDDIIIKQSDKSRSFSTLNPNNKRDKNFFTMEFALSRVEFNILKSVTVEEMALFKKSQNNLPSPFKNYLNFVLNNFNFNLSVSEKKNMKLNLKIFNMCFFDSDFIYRSGSPPQQELQVHPEFQCIMGSINDELEILGAGINEKGSLDFVNKSRTASIYSEAHEDPEEIMKYRGRKIQSFIEFNYNFISVKNKSEIKLNFTKLLICPNLSTLLRLIKFGRHYGDLYKNVTSRYKQDIINEIEIYKELDVLKEAKEAKRLQGGVKDKEINKKFFKKVLTKMENRKTGIDPELVKAAVVSNMNSESEAKDSLVINTSYNTGEGGIMLTGVQNQRKSHIQKVEVTYIVNEKSKLNFSFEMKEIELNFPLEANSENTKVLKLNFNMMVKLKGLTELDNIYTVLENKLIKQNYIKKSINMNLMIFNVDFAIINFQNNNLISNPASNKILSNSRVTLSMKNFLLLEKETNVMNIDFHVEPISMMMGFKQVRVLQKYMKAFGEFVVDMNKTEANEFFENDLKLNIPKEVTENYQGSNMANYKSKIIQQVQEINEQLENQIKYNITNFNNLMDVNFKLDKAIIKLINNTGYYDIPLNKIECSKVSFKFISNSDPCDSDNMAQALVEMISRKEVTHYNIFNMYMYLDACFNVEILTYNEKVSDWEAIMEPWNAIVKMSQVSRVTRLKIDFLSDVILNLNLSFYSLQVFNQIMKKLSEDETDWVAEDRNLSAKGMSSRKLSQSSGNEISLEFVNSTGIEFTFWLDAEKTQKHILRSNDTKNFSKNEMNSIYKKLTDSEISLMKKDKFTFSIFNCDPVEGVDFSYNHYFNIRIPLNKTLMVLPEGPEQATHDPHEYNFIEVSIKIKNSGLIKSISIESNVTIHNNTQFRIGLHVVKSNDFINNFNGEGSENNIKETNVKEVDFEEASIETIKPYHFIKIPLVWMTQNYMVFGRILDDKDEHKAYKMFYEELNFIYKFGDEYMDSNIQQNEDEKEKEKVTQKFTNKYSKIVSFDYENKQMNFALDLLLLKSSSNAKILKEDKSLANVTNTFYYMLVINPPMIIENQIPYNLNFSYGKGKGRENNNSSLPDSDNTCNSTNLLPLQKYPVFYVNYLENSHDLKLDLSYFKNLNFESDYFSFLDDVEENKKIINLYNKDQLKENKGEHSKVNDYYEIVVKYGTMESLTIFNHNYLKLERMFSKSKKMIFYVEFLIVNKLDTKLYIKSKDCVQNDEELNKSTNNTIHEHKVNLFNLPLKQEKAKIKSAVSEWSNPFQINTHGVDGVVSLVTKSNNLISEVTNSSIITDVGMIISSSSYFNYSTVIILEPRYLLVNHLGIDLHYRQMMTKDLPNKEIIEFTDNSTLQMSFKKNEDSKNIIKYLQFVINNHHDKEFKTIEEHWSPNINIDNIEEFNIRLNIPDEDVNLMKSTHGKNVFTYDGVNYFLLTRVTIHSNDNVLIYIILSTPKSPQLMIKNMTEEVLVIKQDKLDKNTKKGTIKILPNTEVPFTWCDLLQDNKKVLVGIGAETQDLYQFSFEKIEKRKEVKLSDKRFVYISVLMENKNVTRQLRVQTVDKDDDVRAVKEMFTGKKISRILKVNLSLKGIGLSIIDDTPKEIFYISFYCLDVRYVNNIFKSTYSMENTENVEIYLKNFQIDYCLEDSFKLIIFPKAQILPSNEKEKEKEGDIIPYIQLLVTRKTIHNFLNDNKTTKISQIDFSMQELNVKIDQSVLNTLLSLVNSFLGVLDFYKVTIINTSSFKKELSAPEDYCPTLKTDIESYEKIIEQNDESNMIFIEALMISGLKINLTLRIDISTLEINLVPGVIIKVLGTLGNAIARITDSPLRFSEMIIQNLFTDTNRLIKQLQGQYIKQGIVQFYKIIGSSDLIGNPIGLVDRLGTGFIEFFNEPRKGFLQGPKQFGKGVAKGLNSLVSNVIGGGFDTVGKITGTLLTATKNLQGEKLNLREEDEPDNVISGAYDGVKGGITEIGKGIIGIFMNPYKSAKQEGVKGFFKGVGTGILGALISPFSAVLKVGNSLAVGLRNTATYFNRGKLKTERFRHPRFIVVNEPLKPYDENYAEVQAIIRNLGDLSDDKLIFFADFLFIDQDLGKEISTLIITDRRIMVIYHAKEKVFNLEIRLIRNSEVHVLTKSFILVFYMVDGSKKFILTEDVVLCCQVHGILQKLIHG